tara:strand:+ start:105 stop:626 length:522 start_codon:yes stop_codon:yes gene_type:complete
MELVYLIHAEDTKRYKIGTTKNGVESRLKELQTGCPFKLRPVKSIVGGRNQEEQVHRKFKEYQKHGEWFEFDGHVKRKVMKYMDTFGDESCQEWLIEVKDWKEGMIEGFLEKGEYRSNLESLLQLALMNIELGCWEEAIENIEEYFYHVYGDHCFIYGKIKPDNILYQPRRKK